MGEKVEILLKVCCIGLLLFQGSMLNLYLSILRGVYWWFWYGADVVVIIVWVGCLVLASKRRKQDLVDGHRNPKLSPDEIRYAFIAWIVYATALCPRAILLFQYKARSLVEDQLFGPNFLKVSISCTPLIFLLLVRSCHDAKPFSKRKYLIMSIGSTVTLDLFDSIDLLEFCFDQPSGEIKPFNVPDNSTFNWVPITSSKPVPISLFNATLAFACINLFLPTLALAEIRVNRVKGRLPSPPFKILYEFSYVFLVNIPNLVIRSLFWHIYNVDVSILIMKNVMCIAMGCMEIYEYLFEDERQKKCEKCNYYFESTQFVNHKEQCFQGTHENLPLA